MTVHAGQRLSTMAEAMAHNTHTIIGDIDLLRSVLAARKDMEAIQDLEQAGKRLLDAYAGLLGLFQAEVGREVQDHDGHVHQHDQVGEERSLVEVAHHDARLARRYETR